MNPKYSLKVIQQGQAQKVQTLSPGAGMQGQALVVQAVAGARLQLADIVTLAAPEKLQMKRVGKDLQVALPGGEVDAPDIVVKDYYAVQDVRLQGQNLAGEWKVYNATDLPDMAPPSATPEGLAAQNQNWSSGHLFNPSGEQSVGMTEFTAAGAASGGAGWGTLTAVGLGGVALASGGGGGGGGSSTTTPNPSLSGLEALKAYASATDGAGVTAPTLKDYSDADIKTFKSLTDTSRKSLGDSSTALGAEDNTFLTAAILNTALDKLDGATLDKDKVQAMVDAYYRILKEADGDSTLDKNVYAGATGNSSDPKLEDYTAIGVTVGDAIGGNKTLDLLNDAIGCLAMADVDTASEVQTLANTANDVMALAKVNTTVVVGSNTQAAIDANVAKAASQTDANLITGLNALLKISTVSTKNIGVVKAAIAAKADNGTDVDTVQELLDVVKVAIALQTLKDFTNDSGAIGSKSPDTATPTLGSASASGTYTDLGIKTFKSVSDTSEGGRRFFGDNSTAGGAEDNTFLTAAILNTALDKLDGATLDKDKVQAMVDAYYRILKEADGDSTVDKDVYAGATGNSSDPKLGDYTAIGVTVGDAISATTYNTGTGVGNETLDLLNDAIGRLTMADVDTASEVQTLADTANDVMALASGAAASQTDANLITGLNALLGLNATTGLNADNLAAFKTAVSNTNDNGTEVDTVEELQSLLGLVRLKAFTDDSGTYFVNSAANTKSTPSPSLNDWSATGVKANISLTDANTVALNQAAYWKSTNAVNGLMALNSALDTYQGSQVNKTSLQSIVDSYGRILQAADGNRSATVDVSNVSQITHTADVSVDDLSNIGVSHSGNNDGTGTGLYYLKTGALLASSIGSLASTSVDTLQELNTLAGYAEAVMKQAAGASTGYTDTQWVTAINALLNTNTTTGANTNNIADIKTAILGTVDAGTGVDQWDELQALVGMVRLDDYARLSTGYSQPVIGDYQAIAFVNGDSTAYTTVKSVYLSSYNDWTDNQAGVSSQVDVKDAITAYSALLNSADGNRNLTTATQTMANLNKVLSGTGITLNKSDAGTLLQDVISGLSTSSIDQASELSSMANVVNQIIALAEGNAQVLTSLRTDLASLGLTDNAGNSLTALNGNGTYWVTDAELNYFIGNTAGSTAGINTIKGAGATAVDTWQELQSILHQAIIQA